MGPRWPGCAPRLALAGALCLLCSCQDVRDFAGTWSGARVGDDPVLKVGFGDVQATLEVDEVSLRDISARLSTSDNLFVRAPIRQIAGAEADLLGDIELAGSPLRVYLAFAPALDGGGDALVVVALFSGPRVDLRILRGGDRPLYGVFPLTFQGT